MKYQVLGLMNSGTNLIDKLLNLNTAKKILYGNETREKVIRRVIEENKDTYSS